MRRRLEERGPSSESDIGSSTTSALELDEWIGVGRIVPDDSAGDSPAGIVDSNLAVKSLWLGKVDSARVLGEPRVAAGPNLSLEEVPVRVGVVVGVEIVDEEVAVCGTESKSVIRMAGTVSWDGSVSSPRYRPQSCPMMWSRDPGCGCLMFAKRELFSKKHRTVKSTFFGPCASDLGFPQFVSKSYDVQVKSKDFAPES